MGDLNSQQNLQKLKEMQYSIYILKNQLAVSNKEKQRLLQEINQQKENGDSKKITKLEFELNKQIQQVAFWKSKYKELKSEKSPVIFGDSQEFELEESKQFKPQSTSNQIEILVKSQKTRILTLERALEKANNELKEKEMLVNSLKKENEMSLFKMEEMKANMLQRMEEIKKQSNTGRELDSLKEAVMKLSMELSSIRQENARLISEKEKWMVELRQKIKNIKSTKELPKIAPTPEVQYKVGNNFNLSKINPRPQEWCDPPQ